MYESNSLLAILKSSTGTFRCFPVNKIIIYVHEQTVSVNIFLYNGYNNINSRHWVPLSKGHGVVVAVSINTWRMCELFDFVALNAGFLWPLPSELCLLALHLQTPVAFTSSLLTSTSSTILICLVRFLVGIRGEWTNCLLLLCYSSNVSLKLEVCVRLFFFWQRQGHCFP